MADTNTAEQITEEVTTDVATETTTEETQETSTETGDTSSDSTNEVVDVLDRTLSDEQDIVARLFAKSNNDKEEETTETEEVVEEETEENATEDKKEDNKPSPSNITLVARKEKGLKKREAALQAQSDQLQNTLKGLEAAGIRFNDDGDIDLDFLEGNVTEEKKDPTSLEVRLAKLEAEKLETEKLSNATAQKALVSDFRNEINTFIDKSDKYEIIKLTAGTSIDGKDQVFNLITQYAKETGELLSLDKACELVESELKPTVEKFRTIEKKKAVKKPISTLLTKKAGIVSSPADDKTDDDRRNNAIEMLKQLRK